MGDRVCMSSLGVDIEFRVSGNIDDVIKGFEGLFARRYIPTFKFLSPNSPCRYSAVIHWSISNKGFKVISKLLTRGLDTFAVESQPPAPYINEAPYFFILQILSRLYVKAGYLLLTDSVTISIRSGEEAVLLLGYPHTGKSTILALALSKGYIPLTTENTVLEVRDDGAKVIGGTDVLVYDPEVERVYNVRLPYHDLTRHGYRIYDLRIIKERYEILKQKPRISSIYLLYCSFNSRGSSMRIIKGRKAAKTLWHFATSTIRGDDYYEPLPLSLADGFIDSIIIKLIRKLISNYSSKFYEVFGSHMDVLNSILK